MASGALSLGSRRIGKRVRFPHGPATVMVLEAADPSATDLCSGRPSAARARINGRAPARLSQETCPQASRRAVSLPREGAGRIGAISN